MRRASDTVPESPGLLGGLPRFHPAVSAASLVPDVEPRAPFSAEDALGRSGHGLARFLSLSPLPNLAGQESNAAPDLEARDSLQPVDAPRVQAQEAANVGHSPQPIIGRDRSCRRARWLGGIKRTAGQDAHARPLAVFEGLFLA